MHVWLVDWKKIDVSLLGKEPKLIKIESFLSESEIGQYKNILIKFKDKFA